MTVRLLQGADIRKVGMDLRRMSFAFSPDYLSAVAARRNGDSGVFKIETQEGQCFLPVVLFNRKFLKVMTIQGSPSDIEGRQVAPKNEAAALEALIAYVRKAGLAHRITQPTNWSLFQRAPLGAVSASFGSYVLPLTDGVDALWRKLHQKHRNAIRNAENNGVRIAHGAEQLDPCFSLYQLTMQRNQLSHEPYDLLSRLLQSEDFSVYCGVAYVGARAVGALFAPYNLYGAYYLFGGTSDDMGVNGANNLLHFEAIRSFVAQGVTKYDFVGARLGHISDKRLAGIQRFKSRFGPELRQGVIWKKDLSERRCQAYDSLIALRSRMRGRKMAVDIIDQQRQRSGSVG